MSTEPNIENHKSDNLVEIDADLTVIESELNKVVDGTHPQMSEASLGAWLISLWEKAVKDHDAEKILRLQDPMRIWADYASERYKEEASEAK